MCFLQITVQSCLKMMNLVWLAKMSLSNEEEYDIWWFFFYYIENLSFCNIQTNNISGKFFKVYLDHWEKMDAHNLFQLLAHQQPGHSVTFRGSAVIMWILSIAESKFVGYFIWKVWFVIVINNFNLKNYPGTATNDCEIF